MKLARQNKSIERQIMLLPEVINLEPVPLEIIKENIENTIFPHPTLSEAIHESVLKASDREIHI